MPRLPRPQIENGLYHIVVMGVRKSPLYHDSPDRREMLRQLATAAERYDWRVLAYCLMTNHFHLVVKTVDPTISRGMQWLNSRYAEYFNGRYRLEGHALERRFWSKVVKTEDQLPTTIRYVLRNPVEAGICAHPAEWRWSSYRATAGLAPCPRFLDARAVQLLFASDPATGAKRFAAFVSADDRESEQRSTRIDLRA